MAQASSTHHITWSLSVAPEVLTEYACTKLGRYYTDAHTMLYTQLRAAERFRQLYGVEVVSPHIATPAYVGVAALGADVVFPEDHAPMIANQGRVLPEREQVLALTVPEPAETTMLQRLLAMQHALYDTTGQCLPLTAGQEGPVTSAVLLRGEQFLEDLHVAPDIAHKLLCVVTDTYIAFTRYVRTANHDGSRTIGLPDDFAGLIAPAMWPEFVVPYWRRIFEALGPAGSSLHSELLRRQHLPYLKELDISHFDPGVDQYLSAAEIAQTIDIPFTEYVWPVRDLLMGTPGQIRRLYEEYVRAGVAHVDADVSCRGIPPANIRAFLDVARQYE